MSKFKIIVNPAAGKGLAGKSIPEIEQALNKFKIEYEIVLTEHPWHAALLTKTAIQEGFSKIVAVGGDGTCNEVLNGIMLAQNEGIGTATLGVIPIGRGNDFAFSMGIPTEMEASVKTLAKGFSKKVDVGLIRGELYPEGRYFGNGVGIGFDAMVGFVAAELNLSGFLAYLVSALKTMKIYKPAPTIRLEMDGQEPVEHSFLMVSIMNGRRMGGGFMMAPVGLQDDGFFDVCMAKEVNNFTILKLITKFTKGTQNEHEAVDTVRTTKIQAQAVKGTLPVHADGETICVEGKEVSVEILSQRIDLFTLAKEE